MFQRSGVPRDPRERQSKQQVVKTSLAEVYWMEGSEIGVR